MVDALTPPQRRVGRTVVWGLLCLAVLAAITWWLLSALVLAALRCGDNCGAGQAGDVRYLVQAGWALLGSSVAAVGLALGFTSHRTAAGACLGAAVVMVLVWWVVVTSSGL